MPFAAMAVSATALDILVAYNIRCELVTWLGKVWRNKTAIWNYAQNFPKTKNKLHTKKLVFKPGMQVKIHSSSYWIINILFSENYTI